MKTSSPPPPHILSPYNQPNAQQKLTIENEAWLAVSDIVRGVGFTIAVQISVTLNDVL